MSGKLPGPSLPGIAADTTGLTIAGFDPSSGAGVSADLLVFAAHSIFATAAITALTVQSTQGVESIEPTEPPLLWKTLTSLEGDLPPSGIKIGMLATADHVDVVAQYLASVRSRRNVQVVLDPVLHASSGAALLAANTGADALRRILPLVDAITPNLDEAAALTGLPCANSMQMEQCAASLLEAYPTLNVVLTGGHLAEPADLLCNRDGMQWFAGEHIESTSTHGTGCAFSTALLAGRLQGKGWAEAALAAKQYVADAMRRAVPRGKGRGPLALLPGLGRSK